jgi:hypothetical protein
LGLAVLTFVSVAFRQGDAENDEGVQSDVESEAAKGCDMDAPRGIIMACQMENKIMTIGWTTTEKNKKAKEGLQEQEAKRVAQPTTSQNRTRSLCTYGLSGLPALGWSSAVEHVGRKLLRLSAVLKCQEEQTNENG